MKNLLTSNYFRYIIFLIVGLLLGRLLFHTSHKHTEHQEKMVAENKKSTIWTCSMHPQIRMSKPGKCPICGMDLIPLQESGGNAIDPDAIVLTPEAVQLANIQTSVVKRSKAVKEIRLYGKVQFDERLIQNQVAHLPGRIEKLMVNFTGESVSKGQILALLYSPELITAQQELFEAKAMKALQPEIYAAAREKLRAWKLSDAQIDQIEQSGKVITEFPILANTSGVVSSLRVKVGDHVSEGTILFEVVDLSMVWILFDAYESDLPFIRKGSKISFTVQALPGKLFESTITFIDPVINPITRVAKVRAEIANAQGLFKPEMFITGTISADVSGNKEYLIIPRSAVLWTGKRSIVYVKLPETTEPAFKIREVILGHALGDSYIVESGLNEGEEIVTEGTFSVDAAAQLAGKPSMMSGDAN